MYLKTSFDQLLAFLQVLKPIISVWAIMAYTQVITTFQTLCGIGLTNTSHRSGKYLLDYDQKNSQEYFD